MQAVRPDEADIKLVERPGGTGRRHNYVGSVGNVDMNPQGFLVERAYPKAIIHPHFHDVDQFQIVVKGDGKIGKKVVRPITFQYADAYTPYGPIVANYEGISFFTLRPFASGGHWGMPGNKQHMPGRAGRNIDGDFDCGTPPSDKGEVEVLDLLPKQEDGVAVYGLRLGPETTQSGFAPSGGGQFYLVCSGSIIAGDAEFPEMSLIYIGPDEDLPTFIAGSAGVELLMVQFATPSTRPGTQIDELQQRTTYQNLRNH